MVRRKVEEINFTCIECLLFTFHHLAHKVPNATNSLCGYKIVTGQPSDRLGDDSIEDMFRALKLIVAAKTQSIYPIKKESGKPKKSSSSRVG